MSFLPRFAVEDELKRGTLVELPFSETPLTIHALCAHHAGKAISPAMRVFMQVHAGGTRGALKFGDENDESLNHC